MLGITVKTIFKLSVLLRELAGAWEQPNFTETLVMNLGYSDFTVYYEMELRSSATIAFDYIRFQTTNILFATESIRNQSIPVFCMSLF